MSQPAHGVTATAANSNGVQAAREIVSKKHAQSIARLREHFVIEMCMAYAANTPEDTLRGQDGWPVYEMVRRMVANFCTPELQNFGQSLLQFVRRNPGSTVGALDAHLEQIFANDPPTVAVCHALESIHVDNQPERRNFWIISHRGNNAVLQVGIMWRARAE